MSVIPVDGAAEASKAIATAKGGETFALSNCAGFRPNWPATQWTKRVTLQAVTPVDGCYGGAGVPGPLQLEGDWNATAKMGYAFRLGRFTDVVCGQTFHAGSKIPQRGNGLDLAGPGKVEVDGSRFSDLYTSININGDFTKGALDINVHDYLIERAGNDGFNIIDYRSCLIEDGKILNPNFLNMGGHQDGPQFWAKTGMNGFLRIARNEMWSIGQCIYLCDDQHVAPRLTWAYDTAEFIENDIHCGTVGGIFAKFVKNVLIGGNRIQNVPNTMVPASVTPYAANIVMQNCGTVVRAGNVVADYVDRSGHLWRGSSDPLSWPIVPVVPPLDINGINADIDAAIALATVAKRDDVLTHLNAAKVAANT